MDENTTIDENGNLINIDRGPKYGPESIPQFGVNFEREQRIKIWMGWALIITALCVDLVELGITWLGLVVVGGILSDILAMVAGFLFWVWFLILGVTMSSNTKRFGVSIVTFIAEMIPGFDAIPLLSFLWTIGMIVTVGMTRMEDKGEKPSILGGIREGLTTLSILNPATFMTLKIQDKIRRSIKRRLGIGQADWVKQEEKTRNTTNNLGRIQQIKDGYQTQGNQFGGKTENNVLDLKNKDTQESRPPISMQYRNESKEDRQKRLEERRQTWQEQEKQEKEMAIRKYGGQEKWDANIAESERMRKQQKELEGKIYKKAA